MRDKIVFTIIAVLLFGFLFSFFVRQEPEKENTSQKRIFSRKIVYEGEVCSKIEEGVYGICQGKFSCQKNICVPEIKYEEIINPKEDRDYYSIAEAGPYKQDYILHVDRWAISEKLFVWIGTGKSKPHWFKARREKMLRRYELEVPKGSYIIIKLSNKEKLQPPEFRGKIYLTRPDKS